jgi:hypothetical protein
MSIISKQLVTKEDFESLKKGDVLACQFHRDMHDHPKKSFRFKVFEIAEVKTRTKEIILQRKNNLFFNYGMFIDPSDGISNLKSAVLIYTDES